MLERKHLPPIYSRILKLHRCNWLQDLHCNSRVFDIIRYFVMKDALYGFNRHHFASRNEDERDWELGWEGVAWTMASIWRWNMPEYLCADIVIICCELWRTDNVQGQIFQHMFASWEAIMLIIHKCFSQHTRVWKLGNVTRITNGNAKSEATNEVFWARETDHSTQTLVFTKTAGRHILDERLRCSRSRL